MNCKIILVFLFLSSIAYSMGPPVWPKRFTQDYFINDTLRKHSTSGKIWVDVQNSRERYDIQNSAFDLICSTTAQTNTSCT